MGKNSNFSGQPIFNELLKFIDKSDIRKIAKKHNAEKYVKKFTTYNHLVVMLFVAFKGFSSIRELISSLLSEAHKLKHLGIFYIVARSTFSEANNRRESKVFEDVYNNVYNKHKSSLTDSTLSDMDTKRLYAMDSTTISLFNDILKGTGRNPLTGKKKGGIKAHTIMKVEENVPFLIRYSEAIKHDHTFLDQAMILPAGSIITFDKGYVDYAKYEEFTTKDISYVTRLKSTAKYKAGKEFEIPEKADSGVLKDEEIFLEYGIKHELKHKTRRIAYWDNENTRLFEFITNNFILTAEKIALIYKRRWKIELLFKQLKQNFPLKYFLGDSVNAIEIQIWAVMLANLLLTLIKRKVKRKWAFSNLVSITSQQLMSYVNLIAFLEDPERCWRDIIKENSPNYQKLITYNQGELAFEFQQNDT